MNIHEILLNISAKGDEAREELRQIATDLKAFGQTSGVARAGIDTAEARAELTALAAALTRIDLRRVSPEIRVQIADDLAKIIALNAALDTLDRKSGRVRGALGVIGSAAKTFGENIAPKSVNIAGFTFGLNQMGLIGAAVAGTIGVSLAGAVLALAGSLTLAITALGGLAVAFGGVLLPAVVAVVGVIANMSGAIDTATGRTKEQQQAIEQQEEAMRAVKTAAQGVRDAERALAQAKRDAIGAEKDLAQARRESAAQLRVDLRNAIEAQADAEYALVRAQQDQLAAQQALNDARRDAIRNLIDLRFASEGAALNEKRAVLALKEARDRLDEMKRGGAPADLIKEARLRIKEAELELQRARETGKRAEEDLNEAESDGVEGSDNVVSAKERIVNAQRAAADASRDLADATRELVKVERAQARPADAVVQARESLADANRRVTEAQRGVRRQTEQLTLAQQRAAQATEEQEAALSGFASRITAILAPLARAVQPIVDALDRGFNRMKAQMAALGPAFATFVDGAARATDAFFDTLSNPETQAALAQMLQLAAEALRPLAVVSAQVFRLLTNIANAALPTLVAGLESFSGSLDGLISKTSNIESMQDSFAAIAEHLRLWLSFIGSISRAWFAFSSAAAPAAADFLGFLTDAADSLADWANSEDGREEIQKFFDDTLPLVESFLDLVGNLIGTAVKFAQLMAPALKEIIDLFNVVVDVVNFFLDLLNMIPAPFRALIGVAATGFGIFTKLGVASKVLRAVFGGLVSIATGLANRLGDLAGVITGALLGAFRFLGNVGRTAFTGLFNAARSAISFMAGLPGRLFNIGRAIIAALIRGLGSVAGGIFGWFRDRFRETFNHLRNIATTIVSIGARIIRGLFSGLAAIAGGIVGFFRRQFERVFNFLGSLPGRMYELGKNVIQGFIDGIKDVDLEGFFKDKFGSPLDITKRFFGIGSPSKEMHKLGEFVAQGFANGINAGVSEIRSAASSLNDAAEVDGRARLKKPQVVAAGAGGVEMHNHFTVPGGGSPDPEVAVGALVRKMRARGQKFAA